MARSKAQTLNAAPQALKVAQARIDTLENLVSGLGVYGRDKREYGRVIWKARMTEQEAEDWYAGDGLPRRIVELLPQEATREWIDFDEEDADVAKFLKKLQVQAKFYEADVAARTYGGACLFINDGTPRKRLAEPLELDRVKEVKSLVLMTMHELTGGLIDIDSDMASPNYGYPATYQLMDRRGLKPQPMATIHWTRLIRFDGNPLPLRAFVRNSFWHDSVITACAEATRDFLQSYGGVSSVLNEFRLINYKVKGLADSVAGGHEEAMMDRLKLVNKARTLLGMTVLDQDEELEIHSDTFAGVPEILDTFKNRMAMTTGYPQMILFQDSPGGMNSNGNSELEGWYNTVADYQRRNYRPRLERLLEVIYASKKGPTNGVEPEKPGFTFKRLWQASDKEEAETEKTQAESDQIRMDQGTLDVVDIIKRRFPQKAAELGEAELAALAEAVLAEKERAAELQAKALSGQDDEDPDSEPKPKKKGEKPAPKQPKK